MKKLILLLAAAGLAFSPLMTSQAQAAGNKKHKAQHLAKHQTKHQGKHLAKHTGKHHKKA